MLDTIQRSARILIVGGWPPPYGGNSTHIERLADRLASDHRSVAVADPYRGIYLHPKPSSPTCANRTTAIRILRRGVLLTRLTCASRGAVVHIHASAGGNFYKWAPLLLAATSTARKRVLTLHSGSWVSEYEALTPGARRKVLGILRSFADIICVNEGQIQVLDGNVDSRLHHIPAYLPAIVPQTTEVPVEVKDLRARVDSLVMTSGYGTPIYDYETVLKGVELAQERLDTRLGLVVATYATWDEAYWTPMYTRLKQSRLPVVVTKNLDPATFLRTLSLAQLYVRGTRTDGDAVAIREAASVGVRVLATDAVPRPAGTALFPQGNADQLSELIRAALEHPDLGQLDTSASLDRYHDILAVYDSE